jgi:hypothetical protein
LLGYFACKAVHLMPSSLVVTAAIIVRLATAGWRGQHAARGKAAAMLPSLWFLKS